MTEERKCCRCGRPCLGTWWSTQDGPVCQHCVGKERKAKRRGNIDELRKVQKVRYPLDDDGSPSTYPGPPRL